MSTQGRGQQLKWCWHWREVCPTLGRWEWLTAVSDGGWYGSFFLSRQCNQRRDATVQELIPILAVSPFSFSPLPEVALPIAASRFFLWLLVVCLFVKFSWNKNFSMSRKNSLSSLGGYSFVAAFFLISWVRRKHLPRTLSGFEVTQCNLNSTNFGLSDVLYLNCCAKEMIN